MSKKLRSILTILLLVVFAASTLLLLRYLSHRQQSAQANSLALEVALGSPSEDSPETTHPSRTPTEETQETPGETVWVPAPFQEIPAHMELLKQIDLAALREVNPDVVGWIYIPDTGINYPLLQSDDNEFYLKHSWDGRSNVLGSIFLESLNSPQLTDFNTILYGHNIAGGEMFAPLHNYASEEYRRSHPYIYILSDRGIYRYEVFASYLADLDSPTYGLSFHQTATREEFLAFALENSQADSGIIPAVTDSILTLSTCTGRGYEQRRVVQARMEMIPLE